MTTNEPVPAVTRPAGVRGVSQRWLIGLSAAFCAVAVSLNLWAWFGPPSWGPRIGCGSPEFDFGVRPAGDTFEHRFLLRNTGRTDLVIRDVLMDCTCLSSEVRGGTIAPWQSFELPVRITLKDQPGGELKRRIVVESNDPATPRMVMTLEGRVTDPAGTP